MTVSGRKIVSRFAQSPRVEDVAVPADELVDLYTVDGVHRCSSLPPEAGSLAHCGYEGLTNLSPPCIVMHTSNVCIPCIKTRGVHHEQAPGHLVGRGMRQRACATTPITWTPHSVRSSRSSARSTTSCGSHTFEERALSQRLDPYLVDEWRRNVIDEGRLEGNFDPSKRLAELDREGVAGEVLIPDFGLPFELYSPLLAAQLGEPLRDQAHVDAANDAYNRWLVDFFNDAPARFRRNGLPSASPTSTVQSPTSAGRTPPDSRA